MSRGDYFLRKEAIARVAPKWRLLSYTGRGGDWRWRRAMDLSTGSFPPDAAIDSPIIDRAAAFLRCRHRAGAGRVDERLAATFSDIAGAEQLSKAPMLQLLAVQARVLSGQSDDDIATKTGIDATVIAAYERLFFTCRGVNPKASGWLHNSLIKVDWLPGGATTLRSMALILSLSGGPPVADAILDTLSRIGVPLKMGRLIRGDEPYCESDWRVVRALSIELLPRTNENVLQLMRENVRLRAVARPEVSDAILPSTLRAIAWREQMDFGRLIKPYLDKQIRSLHTPLAA